MQPVARQITVITYALAWCTADWPPPPKPNSNLSARVRMIADHNGRIVTTLATYSYISHRWLVAKNPVIPLYWQQKERPSPQ